MPIEISEGALIAGDSKLCFDKDIFTATVGFEEVERRQNKYDKVYYADLTPKELKENKSLTFTIE